MLFVFLDRTSKILEQIDQSQTNCSKRYKSRKKKSNKQITITHICHIEPHNITAQIDKYWKSADEMKRISKF